MDLKTICCLCLNQLNELSTTIYDNIDINLLKKSTNSHLLQFKDKKKAIVDFLIECSSVRFEELKECINLCNCCSSKITEFYYFKLQWELNNTKLHQLIKIRSIDEKLLRTDQTETNQDEDNRSDQGDNFEIIKKIDNSQNCNGTTNVDIVNKESYDGFEKNGIFVCDVCNKNFCNIRSKLRHEKTIQHNRRVHKTELRDIFVTKTADYVCDLCQKTFKNSKTLQQHFENHVLLLRELFKFHLDEIHLKETLLNTICLVCSNFVSEIEIKQHYNKHKEHKINCQSCLEKCQNLNEFFLHLIQKHNMNANICLKCMKSFRTLKTLQTHCDKHLIYKHKRNYSCVLCYSTHSSHSDFRLHLFTHRDKLNACDLCMEQFETSCLLQVHKKLKHYNSDIPCCSICGKNDFGNKARLHDHLRNHRISLKPVQCTLCNKMMRTKNVLRTHMKIHLNIRRHVCNECGKRFYQTGSLNEHVRQRHSNERPYKCNYFDCTKAFKTNMCLKNHQRIHTGDKRYKCDTCGKQFYQKSPLVIHMRSHTGERPYVCKVCGKSYTSGSKRNRHFHNKHSKF